MEPDPEAEEDDDDEVNGFRTHFLPLPLHSNPKHYYCTELTSLRTLCRVAWCSMWCCWQLEYDRKLSYCTTLVRGRTRHMHWLPVISVMQQVISVWLPLTVAMLPAAGQRAAGDAGAAATEEGGEHAAHRTQGAERAR